MDLKAIQETIRQQRSRILELGFAVDNLERAVEHYQGVESSSYYEAFSNQAEKQADLEKSASALKSCVATVNTAVFLLSEQKLEVSLCQ